MATDLREQDGASDDSLQIIEIAFILGEKLSFCTTWVLREPKCQHLCVIVISFTSSYRNRNIPGER